MSQPRSSPLGLIVLALLNDEPMHVYRMQQRIEQWGKDRVVNVRQRANLYQTIDRLRRLGLIEVQATVRGDKYPDRVVYTITEVGRETAREWLRDMLRSMGSDFPSFPAAVSIMFMLPPSDAREQIRLRIAAVTADLAEIDGQFHQYGGLPRLFMLEEEYRRTMLTAELAWLESVEDDLRTGRLTWNDQWLQEMAATFTPQEDPRRDDE